MFFALLLALETQDNKRFFERIYIEYRQRMYHYAESLIRDSFYAEDIVQEVFVSFLKRGVEHLRRIDREDHLWIYLAACIRNQCRSYIKRKHLRMKMEVELRNDLSESADENILLRDAALQEVIDAIASLPPTYADVLFFYAVDDIKSKQIAELTGLTPSAVRQRIARGKKLLREKLGEDFDL